MNLLLDTNFLLLSELDGIDIYTELRKLVNQDVKLITLSSIMSELHKLSQSGSRRGIAAKIALELLERNNVEVVETSLKADDSLIDYALTHPGVVVCSNDREIKQQLKEKGVQVIVPTNRQFLAFI